MCNCSVLLWECQKPAYDWCVSLYVCACSPASEAKHTRTPRSHAESTDITRIATCHIHTETYLRLFRPLGIHPVNWTAWGYTLHCPQSHPLSSYSAAYRTFLVRLHFLCKVSFTPVWWCSSFPQLSVSNSCHLNLTPASISLTFSSETRCTLEWTNGSKIFRFNITGCVWLRPVKTYWSHSTGWKRK